VAELTQELQATQELLRLQQEAAAQLAEAAKPRSSSGDVPALSGLIVELRAAAAAAEEKAAAAEKQVGHIPWWWLPQDWYAESCKFLACAVSVQKLGCWVGCGMRLLPGA
jgi:hypothetical protein